MSPAYPQPFLQVRSSSMNQTLLRDLTGILVTLLVFTIPWEDQFVVAGMGTLCRGVGIAAFGMAVMAVLSDGGIRVPRPAHLALLLFVLWGALTAFWTVDIHSSVSAIKTYGQLLLLVWLIFEFAPSHERQINLLRAYVLGTCVSAVATFYSYRQSSETYFERSVAAGFDPNDLCLILALSIPMSFYLMTVDSSGLRAWLWRLHPVLILGAAVLTASRGGLLAICGALLIVPLMFRKLPVFTKAMLILTVVLMVAGTVTIVPVERWERLASIPQELSSGTLGDRRSIWAAGWRLFDESPGIGVGIGAFAAAVNKFLGESIVAHNVFLTVLVETGLIGTMLFAAAMGLMAGQVRRLPSLERRFWFVIAITWSLGAMSLSWAHRKPTWLLFAMLAAACLPATGAAGERRASV